MRQCIENCQSMKNLFNVRLDICRYTFELSTYQGKNYSNNYNGKKVEMKLLQSLLQQYNNICHESTVWKFFHYLIQMIFLKK